MTMYGAENVNWNEANLTTLRTMWAAGHSCAAIMVHIPNATRSAVIGKIHRLKLPVPDTKNSAMARSHIRVRNAAASAAPPPATRSRPEPLARRNPSNSIAAKIAIAEAEPGLPERLIEPATGSGLKLIELENHNCRWPFGDPLTELFYFCGEVGADFKDGRPYCGFHRRKSTDRTSLRNPKAFERSAEFASR